MHNYVQTFVTDIGVPDPEVYMIRMSYNKKLVIAHFRDACNMAGLQYEWEVPQQEALVCYLDNLNLSFASIKRHEKIFQEISDKLGTPVTAHMIALFDWLKARSTVTKDNKLPITKQLLIELCAAADKTFVKHEALLIKAIYLAAWGGFMRLCEYTAAKKNRKNHNLHWDAININERGFGISFWTDKASREDPATKHRQVNWTFLPDFAPEVFEQYNKIRPKGADYYFVHENGRPVTRSEFDNFLDACTLQTRWAKLAVRGHGFRIGGASEARIQGENILNIRHMGRWSPTSKAIEPYTRVPFALMKPEKIYEDLPRYHKKWTPAKISFLARLTVQTQNPPDQTHPFLETILELFPTFPVEYPGTLPQQYPTPLVQHKLQRMRREKIEGSYLKIVMQAAQARVQLAIYRKGVAAAARRTAALLRKTSPVAVPVSKLQKLPDIVSIIKTTATQTDKVEMVSTSSQPDRPHKRSKPSQTDVVNRKNVGQQTTIRTTSVEQQTETHTKTLEVVNVEVMHPEVSIQQLMLQETSDSDQDNNDDAEGDSGQESTTFTTEQEAQITAEPDSINLLPDADVHAPSDPMPIPAQKKSKKKERKKSVKPKVTTNEVVSLPPQRKSARIQSARDSRATNAPPPPLANITQDQTGNHKTSPLKGSYQSTRPLVSQQGLLQERPSEAWLNFRRKVRYEDPRPVPSTRKEAHTYKPESKYRFKQSKEAFYETEVDGQKMLMTRKEFLKNFPDRDLPDRSIINKENNRIHMKIRRRVSAKYRRYTTEASVYNRARYRHKKVLPPKPKPQKMNHTIRALITYFMDAAVERDEYPPFIEDEDSDHTDDEFYYKVIDTARKKQTTSVSAPLVTQRSEPSTENTAGMAPDPEVTTDRETSQSEPLVE